MNGTEMTKHRFSAAELVDRHEAQIKRLQAFIATHVGEHPALDPRDMDPIDTIPLDEQEFFRRLNKPFDRSDAA